MTGRAGERARYPGLQVLLLCLLVLAGYAVSLAGDFVWDDRLLIVENERVRQADRVGELLTSSFWETGDRHDRFRSFFRPVERPTKAQTTPSCFASPTSGARASSTALARTSSMRSTSRTS